jgi:hypothetical protein
MGEAYQIRDQEIEHDEKSHKRMIILARFHSLYRLVGMTVEKKLHTHAIMLG